MVKKCKKLICVTYLYRRSGFVSMLDLVDFELKVAFPVVPPVLGGLAPVGGGGAGSLGSLVLVIRGDHGEAVLHEESIVVSQPEL